MTDFHRHHLLERDGNWNQTIPDALRGRLASIEQISYSSGPTLGNLEAGAVAALFGLRTSIVSGGVLCVAGTIVLGVLLPEFRKYTSSDGDVPSARVSDELVTRRSEDT